MLNEKKMKKSRCWNMKKLTLFLPVIEVNMNELKLSELLFKKL